MDDSSEASFDEELISEETIHGSHHSALNTGAFFPQSKHFTVAGGIFTSNTHIHEAPSLPSGALFASVIVCSTLTLPADFRMIPLGDIDLQLEICLDLESGVAGRSRHGASVRRMYSAKLRGQTMTVAMYEGGNAEAVRIFNHILRVEFTVVKKWQRDISRHSRFRHPNLVQFYATATSRGMYATVFHDGFILTQVAEEYLEYLLGSPLFCGRFWIRRSSGLLCAEITSREEPNDLYFGACLPYITVATGNLALLDQPDAEATLISFLTLEQYHEACYKILARRVWLTVPSRETVNIGAVICWFATSQLQTPVEIGISPQIEVNLNVELEDARYAIPSEIMVDGWIRVNGAILGQTWEISEALHACWLSQANHIFKHQHIVFNYEDHDRIQVQIHLTETAAAVEGYLFCCPWENFRPGFTSFRSPDVPFYWSLDPSGDSPLSTEDAESLGFPTIELTTTIYGNVYDASVYAGLRQLHEAKGFDPESQDVARHLDLPLLQTFQWSSDDGNPELSGQEELNVQSATKRNHGYQYGFAERALLGFLSHYQVDTHCAPHVMLAERRDNRGSQSSGLWVDYALRL
ncbi:hypothetical protein C8R43DRAFT_950165 [Mycena crocata]|nr:hypothetical protein C8R43DRAFT_950165 [Mycena crocata]